MSLRRTKLAFLGAAFSALLCQCQSALKDQQQSPARPNILFCIMDDASPHMGAYGYKWIQTPNFDRLAA